MKQKLFIGFFITLIMTKVQGQTKPVTGNWLLTLVETGQKTDQPYIINRFDANGDISIYGTKIAVFTRRNQDIDLNSERFKIYNGRFLILKLTDRQLVLGGNGATLYYKKAYDPTQNNPAYQNLIGTWLMRGTMPTYVRFEADNKFVMLNMEENGNVTTKGSWLFIPSEKTFVVLADVNVLKKKDSILQINQDYMEILNKGIKYQLEKQPTVLSVHYLQINEDALTEPTVGQSGLPWTNDALRIFVPTIKNLHYKRSAYHPEVKTFSQDDISVDIIVNEKKQTIKFLAYKEIEEERIPFITRIKGPLIESYNRFFPQKELNQYAIIDRKRPWKFEGKTYECTVVNGIIGDDQYQYWMINSMPGVFAKIIHDTTDNPENHWEQTLLEIKSYEKN